MFFFFLGIAYAKKDEAKKKPKLYNKVVIYNFETKSDQRKYKYYTQIIPYTIAKILAKSNKYIIHNIPQELRSLRASGLRSNTPEYRIKLRELKNKMKKPDFIITGTSEVEKFTNKNKQQAKRLSIIIKVYNVKKKKSVFIKKKSREVGIYLKRTIDDLSKKIDSIVEVFQIENRKKPPKPISPYRGFYYAISNMSFGIDAGRFYVKGDWNGYYNDNEFVRTYLLFNTNGIFGISLNAEYFSTDTDGNDVDQGGELQVFAGTLGVHLSLRFSRFFRLTFAPAFGGTITKIFTHPVYDPADPSTSDGGMGTLEKKSNDLYFDGAVYFNMNFAPVQVRIGGAYKRLFLSKPLELYSVFAGVGYNL